MTIKQAPIFILILSVGGAWAGEKAAPAWIAAAPLKGAKAQPSAIGKELQTYLEKGAVCRKFDPMAGLSKEERAEGAKKIKAEADWVLCRSEKGWKEKNPAARVKAKNGLVAKRSKQWSLRFSDDFKPKESSREAQRRDERVKKSLRSQFASPHGVTVARFSGENKDLRDGLNAMVSLQSRYQSRRNPAGIDRIHGKIGKPEDSIKIGAKLWDQYEKFLSRKNSDLVEKYRKTGDINTLVALAYRFGPGSVLKWTGNDAILRLPKKARRFAEEYQSNFNTVKDAAVQAMSEAAAKASASILGSAPSASVPSREVKAPVANIPVPVKRPVRKPKPAPEVKIPLPTKRPVRKPRTPPVAKIPIPTKRPVRKPKPVRKPESPQAPKVSKRPKARLPQTPIRAGKGQLKLHNAATGQTISVAFNGSGLSAGDQERFNRIMRDKSGRVGKMSPRLLSILARIQKHYNGKTITILSGYRSPQYNEALIRASKKRNGGKSGVAKYSRHMHGDAADILVQGVSVSSLHRYALSMRAGGVGKYKGWVHVDAGRVRNW